jgi:DNA-binding NtrC family response regulator
VRELRNVIERACILADPPWITEREIARSLAAAVDDGSSEARPTAAAEDAGTGQASNGLLSSLECDHIVRVLEQTGGNKQAAAAVLGLSRRSLYRRLKRHNLTTSWRAGSDDAKRNVLPRCER